MMRLISLASLLGLLLGNGFAHSQEIVGTIAEEYGTHSQFILKETATGELRTFKVPSTIRCKTGLDLSLIHI